MTAVSFVYWLQGFFELSEAEELTAKQVEIIKRHLHMVFVHDIDPKLGDQEHQDELNAIHNPTSKEELSKFIEEQIKMQEEINLITSEIKEVKNRRPYNPNALIKC